MAEESRDVWRSPFRSHEEALRAASIVGATPLPESSSDEEDPSGKGSAGGRSRTRRSKAKGRRTAARNTDASTITSAATPVSLVQKQLCNSVKKGNGESVSRLLAQGADPSGPCADDLVRLPAYFAAKRGHAAVVRLLMQRNADPNKARTDDGVALLSLAAVEGRSKTPLSNR